MAFALATGGAACGDNLRAPAGPGDPSPADAGTSADAPTSTAVDVTFVVAVPTDTPQDSVIHVAGNFQDWDPGSAAHQLTEQDDGRFAITLSFEVGAALQFKFTRGSWDFVEKGADGGEIENRLLTIDGPGTHEFTVGSWADGSPPESTITGNVSTTAVPNFLDDRRVWVYLPPDYDTDTDARYPVLYMFDGQNVFDEATSFLGEWKVDETLEMLIAAGEIEPIIVVAVDNGGATRVAEYTPWVDPSRSEPSGEGAAHLQAFIDVLIPHIDSTYRTVAEAGSRGICGSSLGGLMTLYATYEHADTFGLAASVSPSLWWDSEHMISHAQAATKPAVNVYMDMGTREEGNLVDEDENGTDDYIDDLRAMRDVMVGQGFVIDSDLVVVEAEDHRHNETYWSQRFPDMVRFLFPAGS